MRVPRHPSVWLVLWAVWAGVLWWLSSESRAIPGQESITFMDKVCHFGYFFGGAGLMSAFLYRLKPQKPDWGTIMLLCVVIGAVVGRVDEWHQTWVPNRSGNDLNDFFADLCGTFAGTLVFRWRHRWLA